MIQSLIIALREGVEVALVIAILVVYLNRVRRSSLLRSVYFGLAGAVLASVGAAILLQYFTIDYESLEGYFMLVAGVFVGTMIVWMWMTAKTVRHEIEGKVQNILKGESPVRMHLAMFSFTFLMVVREGIETAIFLRAVMFSSGAWMSIIGTIIGIGGAVMFAVLFIRGSMPIDIVRFLKVTAITLLIFVAQLLLSAAHEFYEYGIFPANPHMMGILGPIVRNNILFVLAIISIPALMLIIPPTKAAQVSISGRSRRLQLSVGFGTIVIVFFLGMDTVFSSGHAKDLSALELTSPTAGVLEIPVSAVDDGNLHRYSIKDGGIEIRFFVLRTGLGKFATAFDACYACYNYGRYFMRSGELICSQCDAPSSLMKLRPTTAEEPRDETMSGSMEGNGCSPIYLPSTLANGAIHIKVSDLQHQRKYFDTSAN